MKDHNFLPECNDEDVCSFSKVANDMPIMLKVGKFRSMIKVALSSVIEKAIQEFLKSNGLQIDHNPYDQKSGTRLQEIWFGTGISCEILKVGSNGWQKGKMKITVSVDFYPDEPENQSLSAQNESNTQTPNSSLDDFRK